MKLILIILGLLLILLHALGVRWDRANLGWLGLFIVLAAVHTPIP